MELPSASTTCTVPRFSSRIPASTLARSPTTTHNNRSGLRKDFPAAVRAFVVDRKSTRLNSSHGYISYAVFCLKKKKIEIYKLTSINSQYIHHILLYSVSI